MPFHTNAKKDMLDLSLMNFFPACLAYSETYLLVILDTKGKIILHNATFEKLMNTSLKENSSVGEKFLKDYVSSQYHPLLDFIQLSDAINDRRQCIEFELPNPTNSFVVHWSFSFHASYWQGVGHVVKTSNLLCSNNLEKVISQIVQKFYNLVIITDTQHKVTWVNEAFTKLTGYTSEEVLGKLLAQLLQFERTNPLVNEYVHQKINNRESVRIEVLNSGKHGNEYWIDVEIFPIYNDKNEWIGFVANGTDITQQKQDAKNLLLLNTAINNIQEVVFLIDDTGKIKHFNKESLRLLGYSREEFLQMHVFDIDLNHPKEYWQTHWEKIKRQKSHTFETTYTTKSGEKIIVEVNVNYVEFHGQAYSLELARNITARKKAEESLRLSREQLAATLNNTPNVAIQWYNERGEVVYWNPASEQLYGITAEHAIGKTLDQLIHTPEEAATFFHILKETQRTQKPYGPYESVVRRHDGKQGWVLATIFAIPAADERTYFVCMDVDITQQKEAELLIKENEQKYHQLLNNLQVGLVVQNSKTEFLMWNKKALDLLGITEEQLIGKTIFDPYWKVIYEDGTDFPPEEQPVSVAIRTQQPVFGIVMGVERPSKNDIVWLLVDALPEFHKDGTLQQVVCTFTDITTIKVAEDIIRKQNEVLKEIAWQQSHEVRRPLANILGLVNVIKMDIESSYAYNPHYIDCLGKAGAELDEIIRKIVQKTGALREW